MIGFNFYQVKRRNKYLNSQSERVLAIDKLRVISILGVILIHTTTRILERTSYNLNLYSSTLFLNQMARFAVPLFFIISGFVLEITYKEGINFKTYIQKRFFKVFVPYVFWSLFYYYLIYTSNNQNLFYSILTGSASYQLYFIPALCIYYIIFPVLHKLYKYISNPFILLFLVILQIYISYQDYFIKNIQFTDSIRVSILGFSFFLLGIIGAHHGEEIINYSKKLRVLLFIAFGFVGYKIFKEGLLGYYKTYNINSFYSSWRPSVHIYTLISTLLFLPLFENVNFNTLSKNSFLVFFIHVVILEFIWKYVGNFVNPNIYFDTLLFASVTITSFLLAHLIHKIPHISKITG